VVPWNCPVAIQGVLSLLVGLASGDVAESTASARTDLSAVERASRQARPWSESLDQMPAGRCGSPALSWSVGWLPEQGSPFVEFPLGCALAGTAGDGTSRWIDWL
jgi:hypothetical protein